MAQITIQVLEGFERGKVFADLTTPVTIGREEDNTIQLNDERVSRFHVKIQEDGGRIILTDLDSTNGTRINGHPVQMRVLQHGDQLSIGRSLLWYGTIDKSADHASTTGTNGSSDAAPGSSDRAAGPGSRTVPSGYDPLVDPLPEASLAPAADEPQELFPNGPPDLPVDLKMAQMAQLSDVLAYIHDQLACLADMAIEDRRGGTAEMRIDWQSWQRLLKLEMQLALYLRHIADPNPS
jgi:hypothetical protein